MTEAREVIGPVPAGRDPEAYDRMRRRVLWSLPTGLYVLGTRSPSASGDHGNRSTTSGSTTVQRRDLVQTDTQAGTLSYARAQTVYNHLGGTITWLPSVGQVIKPGHTLFIVEPS